MSFKTFDLASDVSSLISSINEVVSVSSSIYANQSNIKYFTNIASASAGNDLGGYWQTIYDSDPNSSTSTALMDVTYGFATGSVYNVAATATSSQDEKTKIYRQMASVLLGNPDKIFSINSTDQSEAFFIMIKRGIQKDEIKKGSVAITVNQGTTQCTASDAGSVTAFKQALGGDYAPLKYNGTGSEIGQVWYNAGIVVLSPSYCWTAAVTWSGTKTMVESQYSGSINNLNDGLRNHLEVINFHNQTNLYSTVFFCRAMNSEFNYSSNPTFVDGDKRILVTSGSNILTTRTYITTIGLYDANDNLLAVGKSSKPITKSPDTESVFRLRLDY